MIIREHIIKRLFRSSGWAKVRKDHIKKEPCCRVCGRRKKLEVHHIVPFANRPDLELNPDNLITLCDGSTRCHFVFGHLGNWRSSNSNVISDSEWMNKRWSNK